MKRFEEIVADVANAPMGEQILDQCLSLAELLLEKNRKYGNSALNPVRVFSKADAAEQIRVRLDDKISRLQNLQTDETEDVIMDLMGYLVLLRIAESGSTLSTMSIRARRKGAAP